MLDVCMERTKRTSCRTSAYYVSVLAADDSVTAKPGTPLSLRVGIEFDKSIRLGDLTFSA
jgi:hypothetical protein